VDCGGGGGSASSLLVEPYVMSRLSRSIATNSFPALESLDLRGCGGVGYLAEAFSERTSVLLHRLDMGPVSNDQELMKLSHAFKMRADKRCCLKLTRLGLQEVGTCFSQGLDLLLSCELCDSLEELDLSECSLSRFAIRVIDDYLRRTKGPLLHTLFMTGATECSNGTSVFPSNQTDAQVVLSLCGEGAVHHWGAPRMAQLAMANMEIGEECVRKLADHFNAGGWDGLAMLRLVRAGLGDSQVARIMEGLVHGHNGYKLHTLDLTGNPLVGMNGVMSIALALYGGCCPSLRVLKLNDDPIKDAGVLHLARALESGLSCSDTLEVLELAHCHISWIGIRELAGAFSSTSCPNLHSLDLSRNSGIGDRGVRYLCDSLADLPHLRVLRIEKVGMGDHGANALADVLVSIRSPRITALHLANNHHSQQGHDVIVEALHNRVGGDIDCRFDDVGEGGWFQFSGCRRIFCSNPCMIA